MNALKVTLAGLLLRLCSLLPLAVARGLGRACARLYWFVGGRSRRVTERNIQLAYPKRPAREQRALAQRSLQATGELIAEMGLVWLRPWQELLPLVRQVQGLDLIHGARAQGRGVVVLAPHLGNWEVLGLHLATLGPVVSLYEPPRLPGLDLLVRRARERSGATLVATDQRGVARLLRNLRAGGICGILPDQVPADARSGHNAPFMGVPCFTGSLASKLIRRSGALPLFGFAERVQGGFAVRYAAADPAVGDSDMARAVAAVNRGVARCLERREEQYQWEYKRFRVRPRGEPGLYDDL